MKQHETTLKEFLDSLKRENKHIKRVLNLKNIGLFVIETEVNKK
jgi:hypothetical protein